MKRRKAMGLTATILGGTIIGTELLLSGCTDGAERRTSFSESDIVLLDELGETILPATEGSPGAKAAKVGAFIKNIVNDCYSKKERGTFLKGMGEFEQSVKETYSKGFLELDRVQRHELVVKLDKEAESINDGIDTQFYPIVKILVIEGYFTSEPGLTGALRYNPTPGKYIGCVPYIEGEGYIGG
ncbi:Gluconate 2-dehydrogenase subunit 3 [Pricia antarctica]|uniref:Gluconate 2-dehydrogenase subunit 3 n=1 Tax=Pricia antarctica TaxID=641691 RepID=A0A1G6XVH5_9FLAO|nr:gluconate 2-dehydrogenase subunit 3 family protein [Pricia antarctica]SDD82188.1 Gluconate 2-dehydrogenase subunit 3 [Pricia antarctica]